MPILFLLFLVVPIIELVVIVAAARTFGTPQALVALVLISIVGAWLVKIEGLGVWRRLKATLARGELPHNELVDGVLILVAGALMLTPGFFTDAVGLFVRAPPSRALIRAGLIARMKAGPVVSVVDTAWSTRRRSVHDTDARDVTGRDVTDVGDVTDPDRPDDDPWAEPPSLPR
jgi:UPF0716 protein FxsA